MVIYFLYKTLQKENIEEEKEIVNIKVLETKLEDQLKTEFEIFL